MKKKSIWIVTAVLALVVVVFVGSAVFAGVKKGMEEKEVKEQFNKSFNKIMEMDSQERDGKLQLEENFNSQEYGRFTSLLETEKTYYLKLQKIEAAFEESSNKVLGAEMNFDSPEEISNARLTTKDLSEFMDSYLKSIKDLNEKNMKEIEGLNLPDNYKKVYIAGKKDVNGVLEKYIDKLSDVIKGLAGDLTEMINIIEKIPTRSSQAEVNEDVEKIEVLAQKMDSYNKAIEDMDKEFNGELEEVNKKTSEKIEKVN